MRKKRRGGSAFPGPGGGSGTAEGPWEVHLAAGGIFCQPAKGPGHGQVTNRFAETVGGVPQAGITAQTPTHGPDPRPPRLETLPGEGETKGEGKDAFLGELGGAQEDVLGLAGLLCLQQRLRVQLRRKRKTKKVSVDNTNPRLSGNNSSSCTWDRGANGRGEKNSGR